MALIKFVANYDDLSTDRGYQFKFYCDKCRNGYLSAFQANVTGMAGGLLRAAGNLFGGVLGRVGNSTYEIQRAIGGKAHDDALLKAVEEGKQHFKQCSRCGMWVCPEVCWNQPRGLCEACAPDEKETLAAAQAQATSEQIFQKARETNLVGHIDMSSKATAETPVCPTCGAKTTGSKFCPECGGALVAKIKCKRCGVESVPSTLFCPDCGNKMTL
ncbi:zinc ribbon domain-containing protein [bacterium]|nr:zinc ribbon domain-containing protein [bacterium]